MVVARLGDSRKEQAGRSAARTAPEQLAAADAAPSDRSAPPDRPRRRVSGRADVPGPGVNTLRERLLGTGQQRLKGSLPFGIPINGNSSKNTWEPRESYMFPMQSRGRPRAGDVSLAVIGAAVFGPGQRERAFLPTVVDRGGHRGAGARSCPTCRFRAQPCALFRSRQPPEPSGDVRPMRSPPRQAPAGTTSQIPRVRPSPGSGSRMTSSERSSDPGHCSSVRCRASCISRPRMSASIVSTRSLSGSSPQMISASTALAASRAVPMRVVSSPGPFVQAIV